MRVFVTGATGALGRHLVPGLVAAGHQVTATTRSPAKTGSAAGGGRGAGRAGRAGPGGGDRGRAGRRARGDRASDDGAGGHAQPAPVRRGCSPSTNELRTKGTDNLLAAAAEAGTRRVVAQSYTGWTNERSGGPVKTENDPLDPRPLPSTRQSTGGDQARGAGGAARGARGSGAALRQLLRLGRVGCHARRGAQAAAAGDRRRGRDLVVHRVLGRGGRHGRGGRRRRPRRLQHRGRRPGAGRGVAAVPGGCLGREAAAAGARLARRGCWPGSWSWRR